MTLMRAAWFCTGLLLTACRTTAPAIDQPVDKAECRCEDGCSAACPAEPAVTAYRTVTRDAAADKAPPKPQIPWEVVDASAGTLLEGEALTEALATLRLEPDEVAAAAVGDFALRRGDEVAVLAQTGELTVYGDGAKIAAVELGTPASTAALEVVRLVDRRAEIVVRHVEEGVERLTVCRVIGAAIGRVYESDLEAGGVEYVQHGEERAIRFVGAAGDTAVYQWNQWEGMFRIPSPAPTAPR